MVYKFRLISDENENFFRDIEIKSTNNFFEFHQIIQNSVNFDKSQIASFFISNSEWEKLEEITLMDMSDFDETKIHVMHKTKLDQFIKEVGDKLIYAFDFFSDRCFYIELMKSSKNDTSKKYPVLINGQGKAPKQILVADININDFNDIFDDDLEDDMKFESLDELGEI